ncbi:MAG: metallophosphatase family protein [Acidobacteriota bacterium]|nr:metallophosphatase family protein [Acidobacteriota bacterium]
MPYLILSDIHANLEAHQAVLADAKGKYDRILCLGDLVGYGADPNAIVEWTRENVTAVIRGNHDRVSVGGPPGAPDGMETFNPVAQASTVWTRNTLLPGNREYLERLPRGPLPYEGLDLIHGSPADEDEYVVTASDAAPLFGLLEAAVTFFGHTHRQGGFRMSRRTVARIAPDRALGCEANYFYLVNPGSVGQPRDGDPRAAYALYSPEERAVEFCRVAYDVERAAAKIRAAGLPDFLAARLHEGM